MITPDPAAMELAAEWLEMYEDAPGTDGPSEALACQHVASWLRQQSSHAQIRRAAREAGCSVGYARKFLMTAPAKDPQP